MNHLLVASGAKKYIGEYTIKEWIYKVENDKNSDWIVVNMILSRQFFSIFLVTYLPTILMNIINQASNQITGESKFDMILTINITSMMVQASIYLSVSTSLPSTPTIKPVEI